ATTNDGVWLTFFVILALYAGVGVTLILILRSMSRRWRGQPDVGESDVPYGPRAPLPEAGPARDEGPVSGAPSSPSCCSSASPRTPCSAGPTSVRASGTSSRAAHGAASDPGQWPSTPSDRCGRRTTSG